MRTPHKFGIKMRPNGPPDQRVCGMRDVGSGVGGIAGSGKGQRRRLAEACARRPTPARTLAGQ